MTICITKYRENAEMRADHFGYAFGLTLQVGKKNRVYPTANVIRTTQRMHNGSLVSLGINSSSEYIYRHTHTHTIME